MSKNHFRTYDYGFSFYIWSTALKLGLGTIFRISLSVFFATKAFLDKGQLIPTKNLKECIEKYNGDLLEISGSLWNGDHGDDKIRIRQFKFFSEGTFRVELDVSLHNSKRITSSDIYVSFEVINQQRKSGEPTNTISPNQARKLEKLVVS